MRRLINIDPSIQLDPEPKGHEFGCYVFDILPDINTHPKQDVIINMLDNAILTQATNFDIGMSKTEIQELQKKMTSGNIFSSC